MKSIFSISEGLTVVDLMLGWWYKQTLEAAGRGAPGLEDLVEASRLLSALVLSRFPSLWWYGMVRGSVKI